MKKQFNAEHSKVSFYHTSRWRILRKEVLSEFWKCIRCENTFNLQIDHIFEVENNEELFFWKPNLRPLCISCHTTKTMRDKNNMLLPVKSGYDLIISDSKVLMVDEAIYNFYKKNNSFSSYLLKIVNTEFSNPNHQKIPWKNIDIVELKSLLNLMISQNKFNWENIIINNIKFDSLKKAMEYRLQLIKEEE